MHLEPSPYRHFVFLVRAIEHLILNREEPWPVERTLLTTCMLDAAMHSRHAGGTPVEALRATVLSLGEQAAADRGVCRAVVAANLMNPVLGGFAESVFGGIIAEMNDDVRAAQRAGLLTDRVEANTIAETLITAYLGAALHFATGPNSRPLLELLSPVLEASLDGFAPRKP